MSTGDAAYWRQKFAGQITGYAYDQKLDDVAARAIAVALKDASARSLTQLDLHNNSIGDEGAIAIADALKTNSTLEYLWLGNAVGDAGTGAFAELLKAKSTGLKVLVLWGPFTDNSVRALANALKNNTKLTALGLRSQSVRCDGARAFAEMLAVNSTLTTLDLQNSSIGDDGARALLAGLELSPSITQVVLTNNPVSDTLKADIAKLASDSGRKARALAAREEAARKEAARQEAARQEAARQEAARQEAARKEAARQEAARQEAARQEAARQEAARQAAAKSFLNTCSTNDLDAIRQHLADQALEPNARDASGLTGFALACRSGHLRAVELLLAEPRVDADAADAAGETGFILACRNKHAPVIAALLKRTDRVDVTLRNAAGESGAEVARKVREADAEAARIAAEEKRKKDAEIAEVVRVLVEVGLYGSEKEEGDGENADQQRGSGGKDATSSRTVIEGGGSPAVVGAPAGPSSDAEAEILRLQKELAAAKQALATAQRELDLARKELSKHSKERNLWIEKADIEMFSERKLGTGAFGDVFAGRFDGQDVAIKVIHEKFEDEERAALFDAEIRVWIGVPDHQNVLSLLGYRTNPTYMVTKLCTDGDADSYLARAGWDLATSLAILADAARGLEHLHASGVIHCDLKLPNVLVDGGRGRVCDFGFSRTKELVATGSKQYTYRGMHGTTVAFAAPEVLDGEPARRSADVFMFAHMIFRALSKGTAGARAHGSVAHGLVPKMPEGAPAALWDVCVRCWSQEPAERPEIGEVVAAIEGAKSLGNT
ncbi:kinase-like domain-containing protein [Hyaloraphidium curvatum]|nr:kinase-like domain-containing protein [Hyaloraphidium curvatum]